MEFILSMVLLGIFLLLHRKTITKGYALWCFLLVFYLTVMLSKVVGIPTFYSLNRTIQFGEPLYNPIINWIPFSQGFDITSLLNIIAFIPLGVALKVMWKKFQHILPTFLLGVFFSSAIEVSQLFTGFRQSDINDIIMNTLGVVVGWILAKYLFRWNIQRMNGKNSDWLFLIMISIISVFVLGK